MTGRELVFERLVGLVGKTVRSSSALPSTVRSLFVLRNNDIGDLLVTTPLFEALRRRFPDARIVAGVGPWNVDILRNNPHVSEVWPVAAPWYNHMVQGWDIRQALRYIATSEEVRRIREARFDVGIDIFGSSIGMLLLLRAGIPYRVGVRGFRGGHSAAQLCVDFDPSLHVSRANLRIAELFGVPATDLPAPRPQLFLSDDESDFGEALWQDLEREVGRARRGPRVLIGPGAGDAEKCWPIDRYAALARRLGETYGATVLVVGGKGDIARGAAIEDASPSAYSRAGRMSLRETFAATSHADLVLCNSSMLMHAAAAFAKPTVTLLSAGFEPAPQHEALWGYPGIGRILGKETCAGAEATVDEAFAAASELLQAQQKPAALVTAVS